MIRRLHDVGFVLLIALLAWVPFPLGSNRPWAWSLFALIAGVLLLLWIAGPSTGGRRPVIPALPALAGVALLATAAWAWLQATPGVLPPDWAHPFWQEVRGAGLEVTPLLALSGENARDGVMRLLAYGAVFLLAFLFGQEARRARTLFTSLLLAITAYALYGLVLHFGRLPWIVPGVERLPSDRLHSSFVNPNNFSTYLNLGILIAVAYLLEGAIGSVSGERLKERLREVIDHLLGRNGFLFAVLLILASASLLTASRGGALALAMALAWAFLLLFLLTRPTLRQALLAAALLFGAGYGLLALSGQATLERLAQLDRATGAEQGLNRLLAYGLSVRMITERPVLGHGYGSYEQAFMLHRDERFPLVFDKAHNTYLEHATELGLPASGVLYLGGSLLFLFTTRGVFRRRRNQLYPLVASAATVLVAVHALVDFSLQIPAVAATYAAILGTGAAQSIPSRTRSRRRGATAGSAPADVRAEAAS